LRKAKKNKPKPCGARFVHQSIAEGLMIFVCQRLSDKRKIKKFLCDLCGSAVNN
jgi:hypothetical protein